MNDPTGQRWQSFSIANTTVASLSNSVQIIKEAVSPLTSQIALGHFDFFFFSLIAVLCLFLLMLFLFIITLSLAFSFFSFVLLDLDYDSSGFSLEVRVVSVDDLVVLAINAWQLLEFEIVVECPVEGFAWEFVIIDKLEGHRDKVVVLKSVNLSQNISSSGCLLIYS